MRILSAAACSASVAVAAAVFANSQNSAAAAAAAATAPDAPNYSFCLEKVVVIARHGARSPTIQFPFADSYLDWRLCGNARTLLRAGDERLMAYVKSVPPSFFVTFCRYPLSKQSSLMNKDCDACSVGELTGRELSRSCVLLLLRDYCLSDAGMYQLQRLGDEHRRRYVHALGALPPCVAEGAALVRARSSPVARTVG